MTFSQINWSENKSQTPTVMKRTSHQQEVSWTKYMHSSIPNLNMFQWVFVTLQMNSTLTKQQHNSEHQNQMYICVNSLSENRSQPFRKQNISEWQQELRQVKFRKHSQLTQYDEKNSSNKVSYNMWPNSSRSATDKCQSVVCICFNIANATTLYQETHYEDTYESEHHKHETSYIFNSLNVSMCMTKHTQSHVIKRTDATTKFHTKHSEDQNMRTRNKQN